MYTFYFFLVTLVSVLMYFVATFLITEWRAKQFAIMTEKDQNYNQKATDSLLNFETVKYFNAERHERHRFNIALDEYKVQNVKTARQLVILNVTQATIVALGLLGNLSLANYLIQTDELWLGDFVMINTYILQLYAPLGFLGQYYRMIRQNMVDVEFIFALLANDETTPEPDVPEPLTKDGPGHIRFENVSFSYDKTKSLEDRDLVLDNLSFEIESGKSTAIVGSTGSGKSTVMKLIYRFYELDEGAIYIDDQDISKLSVFDLRSKIGIVPQDCVLFNDTVRYNIAYGGVQMKEWKDLMDDPTKAQELEDKLVPIA